LAPYPDSQRSNYAALILFVGETQGCRTRYAFRVEHDCLRAFLEEVQGSWKGFLQETDSILIGRVACALNINPYRSSVLHCAEMQLIERNHDVPGFSLQLVLFEAFFQGKGAGADRSCDYRCHYD